MNTNLFTYRCEKEIKINIVQLKGNIRITQSSYRYIQTRLSQTYYMIEQIVLKCDINTIQHAVFKVVQTMIKYLCLDFLRVSRAFVESYKRIKMLFAISPEILKLKNLQNIQMRLLMMPYTQPNTINVNYGAFSKFAEGMYH